MSDKQLPGAQSGIDKLGREAVRAAGFALPQQTSTGTMRPPSFPPPGGAERKTVPFGKC
jgi:hypothetical protein